MKRACFGYTVGVMFAGNRFEHNQAQKESELSGMPEILRRTEALCPECGRRLPAVYRRHADGVYLERSCPEHGAFAVPLWRDRADWQRWLAGALPLMPGDNPHCPTGCGICADHRQKTCCTVLEITPHCNLHCPNCLADPQGGAEPAFAQVSEWLAQLIVPGQTLVQLSGGEPTLRDDLPQIVAEAKRLGCRYVQLNTNGLRLAEDEALVRALAEAGLSFVFLQFDALDDAVYEQLRGRPLLALKERAIANCAKYNLGVTLVAMLVPGVNTDQVGALLRYGAAQSPAVRGVHFQPISYFGRSPIAPQEGPRYTLDELLADLESQSGGLIKTENLLPSHCDHPLCGIHGSFIVLPDGSLQPLSHWKEGATEGGAPDAAAVNREFVGRRWQRPTAERGHEAAAQENNICNTDESSTINQDYDCGPDDGILVATCAPGEAVQAAGCCCVADRAAISAETCCGRPAAACTAQTMETCCMDASETPAATASTCCAATAEIPEPAVSCCARTAEAAPDSGTGCCAAPQDVTQDLDLADLDTFLARARSHGFTVTAMAFQDAATLDIERLRQCSLHVFDRGRLVPFCAYYL